MTRFERQMPMIGRRVTVKQNKTHFIYGEVSEMEYAREKQLIGEITEVISNKIKSEESYYVRFHGQGEWHYAKDELNFL